MNRTVGQPLVVRHVEHKASGFQSSQCVHLQFSLPEVAQGVGWLLGSGVIGDRKTTGDITYLRRDVIFDIDHDSCDGARINPVAGSPADHVIQRNQPTPLPSMQLSISNKTHLLKDTGYSPGINMLKIDIYLICFSYLLDSIGNK